MLSRRLCKDSALATPPRKHAGQPDQRPRFPALGVSTCFRGGVAQTLSLRTRRESMAPETDFTELILQQALNDHMPGEGRHLTQRYFLRVVRKFIPAFLLVLSAATRPALRAERE